MKPPKPFTILNPKSEARNSINPSRNPCREGAARGVGFLFTSGAGQKGPVPSYTQGPLAGLLLQ